MKRIVWLCITLTTLVACDFAGGADNGTGFDGPTEVVGSVDPSQPLMTMPARVISEGREGVVRKSFTSACDLRDNAVLRIDPDGVLIRESCGPQRSCGFDRGLARFLCVDEAPCYASLPDGSTIAVPSTGWYLEGVEYYCSGGQTVALERPEEYCVWKEDYICCGDRKPHELRMRSHNEQVSIGYAHAAQIL